MTYISHHALINTSSCTTGYPIIHCDMSHHALRHIPSCTVRSPIMHYEVFHHALRISHHALRDIPSCTMAYPIMHYEISRHTLRVTLWTNLIKPSVHWARTHHTRFCRLSLQGRARDMRLSGQCVHQRFVRGNSAGLCLRTCSCHKLRKQNKHE